MTLFVDASALVAIILKEPDVDMLADRLERHENRLTSAVALWETMAAVRRARDTSVELARAKVERFRLALGLRLMPIGAKEADLAVFAHARYGKGHHPARLNMGDCFASAGAHGQDAELLYKGDDFALTDLAATERPQ
ncbi:type II toxin-antitoxin system VapC family toxin [uncultured Sphingomonas sp.]|uniref:type II toxin-antitoxin system VapC family toxin n=1 Tax=uncultured Sphingomonas sp. TaxID=158754 RepID=UPI0025F93AF8|nr:type II toxin-antitoxin system VapC family toxin [uncultured Sphingomonas sp.]